MAEPFNDLLLPEPRVNWRTLGTSFLAQSLLVLLLAGIGVLLPDQLVIATHHLTYTPLVSRSSPPPRQQPRPKIKTHLLPPAPVTARLIVPRQIQVHAAKPQAIQAPKVVFAAPKLAPVLVKEGGAMPAIVHTGSFSGSSATPTIVRSVEKVQTGGFGDPNGVPAHGSGQGRLLMAKMGAFDMPQGEGQGNGAGGTRGARGTVASAGFGNGIASPGQGDGRSNGGGAVHAGGFGDAATATAAPRQKQIVNTPATTPVEILSKPKPIYTEEAKQLGVQGEVLVEVLFGANGQAHSLRVVRGLGHGLDQAAVDAANKIHFKPAQQNGQPVDSTAIVHVAFELAY